jgi:hypothetical protein
MFAIVASRDESDGTRENRVITVSICCRLSNYVATGGLGREPRRRRRGPRSKAAAEGAGWWTAAALRSGGRAEAPGRGAQARLRGRRAAASSGACADRQRAKRSGARTARRGRRSARRRCMGRRRRGAWRAPRATRRSCRWWLSRGSLLRTRDNTGRPDGGGQAMMKSPAMQVRGGESRAPAS